VSALSLFENMASGIKVSMNKYYENYRSDQGTLDMLKNILKNIKNSKELIYQLLKRDVLSIHKKTFLGVLWVLFSPVVAIISWLLMNYAGILNPGDMVTPYPVYVVLGGALWGLFLNVYNSTSNTLNIASGYILQVKYAHEVLIVKQVLEQLIYFLVSFALINGILFLYGVKMNLALLSVPLLIMPLLMLGSAIGLIVAVLSAVTNEFKKIIDILIGLVLFVTPVFYAAPKNPSYFLDVMNINPLTYLIGSVRDAVLFGFVELGFGFIYSTLASVFLLIVSLRFFYLTEQKIIEKMN
jgi:lipopolysaccharide transport system permease protein